MAYKMEYKSYFHPLPNSNMGIGHNFDAMNTKNINYLFLFILWEYEALCRCNVC